MFNNHLLSFIALVCVVSASPSTSQDEVVTCIETTTDNVFANPSWESGTSGWEYNWSPSTSDTYSSDGSYSLLLPGSVLTTYTRQSLSSLQVGLTYNVSVDLKAIVNPASSLTQQCVFYIYHDSLTTTNLITSSDKQYTRADTAWATYGGTVTPSSTDMVIGIVFSCALYHSSAIFNAYLDNAIMQAPIQSCTTVVPASTSTLSPSSIATSLAFSSSSEGSLIFSSSYSTTSDVKDPEPTFSSPTVASTMDVVSATDSTNFPISTSDTLLNLTEVTPSLTISITPSSTSSFTSGNNSMTEIMRPTTLSSTGSSQTNLGTITLLPSNSSINATQTTILSEDTIPTVMPLPTSSSVGHGNSSDSSTTDSITINVSTRPAPTATSDTLESSSSSASIMFHNSSIVSSVDGQHLTTLTIMTTSIHTVVSCAPAITSCPASNAVPTDLPEGVSTTLVTETIELSTTICPVTAVEAVSSSILSVAATGGITGKTLVFSQPQSTGAALTTLIVQATSIHTAISCAPTVTDCPGRNVTASFSQLPVGMSTVLVTEVINLSTTVCPVTAAESISSSILSAAASGGLNGKAVIPSSTLAGQTFNGTGPQALSATGQTAVATTLKPIVKKPCHRN